MSGEPASSKIVPLSPRRAATRDAIVIAARQLFFEKGFSGVTMEEVAVVAGIQRSTLYLYFREKEQILAIIAQDYTRKLGEVIARLPAPAPNREEIAGWVEKMMDFVSAEPEATEILVSLSHLAHAPGPARSFGQDFRDMMAGRLEAFRRALEPGRGMELAWAVAAMEELGWALCLHVRTAGGDHARNRLAVATELLIRLVEGTFAGEGV
jgi:AcrR family transcriptional regulator